MNLKHFGERGGLVMRLVVRAARAALMACKAMEAPIPDVAAMIRWAEEYFSALDLLLDGGVFDSVEQAESEIDALARDMDRRRQRRLSCPSMDATAALGTATSPGASS